ncbi:glycosyltransferase family 2 protein [Butyrivibrio sp. JL13D10]|uniref:glycosyltransferase family 2 protein n=1 Tax=Butyrivibrio sp. JL13D10 TaxID=3236815 RepID=UPI0038B48334
MLFSIIVPVYNAEKTIAKCVDSLLRQKVDTQIILVENGSSDKSLELCKALNEQYSNVELYISEESGISLARNIGLSHANGDVIGFCDADDYYDKDALAKVKEIFDKNDIDIVFSAFTRVYRDSCELQAVKKERIISVHKAIEYITCYPCIMGSVWNKFYKKELIGNIRFDNELTHLEDGYFNIRLLSEHRDSKVYVTKCCTYYYIANTESVTGNIENCYDVCGNLKYNVSLYKMLDDLDLFENEKRCIKDKIYRLSVENIKKIKHHPDWYNNSYDEIKKNFFVFLSRVIRFDTKNRIKLVLKGLRILIKGKKNEKNTAYYPSK